jgi:hypothetical protein
MFWASKGNSLEAQRNKRYPSTHEVYKRKHLTNQEQEKREKKSALLETQGKAVAKIHSNKVLRKQVRRSVLVLS